MQSFCSYSRLPAQEGSGSPEKENGLTGAAASWGLSANRNTAERRSVQSKNTGEKEKQPQIQRSTWLCPVNAGEPCAGQRKPINERVKKSFFFVTEACQAEHFSVGNWFRNFNSKNYLLSRFQLE
jgi:hypothetical protein